MTSRYKKTESTRKTSIRSWPNLTLDHKLKSNSINFIADNPWTFLFTFESWDRRVPNSLILTLSRITSWPHYLYRPSTELFPNQLFLGWKCLVSVSGWLFNINACSKCDFICPRMYLKIGRFVLILDLTVKYIVLPFVPTC